ncbi:MAG: type IV secretory system conjugative DNA transfer family protein, partial [Hoeflea sp.]
MLRLKLAWVALKNIGRAAGRDPIWALIAFVTFPFRYGAFFVKFVVGLLVIILIPTFVIEYLVHNGTIERAGLIRQIASSVVIIFALLLIWRAITNALIDNFGNIAGETHGSARFATPKEMAPYSQKSSGLLIGRDPKSKRLLRYDGPSHLITMAPTRTGKGVGTLIPNLLTADRSIICIDPKGENAKIAGRAREQFGPVHILDPFGATDTRTGTFNPMDSLDPASLDLAEDAGTLADALVFDEPGMSGEAHWNEEAKALVAGLILQIVSHEPAARRTLMTL